MELNVALGQIGTCLTQSFNHNTYSIGRVLLGKFIGLV